MRIALTIAGADPSGGAGIQADLKTFAAHGVYGLSVITSVTAQNTVRFLQSADLPASSIKAQLEAVTQDFPIHAVKTGMLANEKIIQALRRFFKKHPIKNLVIDPVLQSKTGGNLLTPQAVETLKTKLLPLALLVTPNIGEAEILSGLRIRSREDMQKAAQKIWDYGVRHVLIKGGDAPFSKAADLWFDGKTARWMQGKFSPGKKPHGTGCAYASAIAAGLAKSQSIEKAIQTAKTYIETAIRQAIRLGQGHELLNHIA